MIDCHCHLLPGLDDGPETVAESLEMSRILSAYGFSRVYCTPHCLRGCYETPPAAVQRGTAAMQRDLQAAGIPLSLQAGMEYSLDESFPSCLENIQTLGESRMVLAEVPSQVKGEIVQENLGLLRERGFIPLVAHPERIDFSVFSERGGWGGHLAGWLGRSGNGQDSKWLKTLFGWQGMGCLFQGNIGSFVGHYGSAAQQRALILQEKGLFSHFGSDGHRPESLAAMLAAAADRFGSVIPSGFLSHEQSFMNGISYVDRFR